MENIINKIISNISIDSDFIDPKKFKTIHPKNSKKMIFIDGGNQEIIGSNNFSLNLIKIAAITMQNNKKTNQQIQNYYCLSEVKREKENLIIQCVLMDKKTLNEIKKYEFKYEDEKKGYEEMTPQNACEIMRRMLEIEKNTEICEPDAMTILDGNFDSKNDYDKEPLEKLFETAMAKKTIIISISKTNQTLTKNGTPIQALLEKKSPKTCWHYKLQKKQGQEMVEQYFVKLHKNSKYSFNINTISEQTEDFEELASNLCYNSKDPIFLGYPYGLIIADSFARVSNEEKDMEKTRIMIKLLKKNPEINHYLNTKNAHEILDHIRF